MSSEQSIDRVLASPRPDFSEAQAVGLAAAAFGSLADSARNLGSERDQTFLLLAPNADPVRGPDQIRCRSGKIGGFRAGRYPPRSNLSKDVVNQ